MRKKSEAIFKKACNVIPGGVNSPARSFQGMGISPLIVDSGAGDTIWDVDGNSYIDYCGAWGSLILGHAHPDIVSAVSERMKKGSSFGISTEEEELIARKIVSLNPSVEKIRFVSSGTEATMTAVRIARGVTEKPKILKFAGHYHGHSDAFLVQAGSGVTSLNPLATSLGVTSSTIADTLCFSFNDALTVRTFFRLSPIASQVAAVILEPITGNMGVVLPEAGFLEMLREETSRVGALLIFDEVITGFRVGMTGAQGLYRIDPDLTCFGKIIGGGFPVAAVGGKAKFLDHLAPLGQVYQAGTLSGNPVAMRAGLETISKLEQKGFYETLQKKTDRLLSKIRKDKSLCVQSAGSMFTLFFGPQKVRSKEDLQALDQERFAQFFRYLFERGIYIPPSAVEAWFVSAAHTDEHLDYTADCINSFLMENKH